MGKGPRRPSRDRFAASYDSVPPVCDAASCDQYGPFTLTLNDSNQVTEISLGTVTLTERTINPLNSGRCSICLDLTSPTDATVRIEGVVFNVGVRL